MAPALMMALSARHDLALSSSFGVGQRLPKARMTMIRDRGGIERSNSRRTINHCHLQTEFPLTPATAKFRHSRGVTRNANPTPSITFRVSPRLCRNLAVAGVTVTEPTPGPELSSGNIQPLTRLVKCSDVSVATMQQCVFGNVREINDPKLMVHLS
ncbi:hypothetical protein DFH09DRAFT_1275158 [Mycena vulgaris]|nr:hypothetical protein DFH09DRAFT_1275158 [Mycena vulgaris]